MKKITKKIITKLSKIDIDYKKERMLKEIISNEKNIKYIDTFILVKDHNVKVRLFIPNIINQVIIYFHGGGFVTGNIHTYSRTCYDLANNTNSLVISVDYRFFIERYVNRKLWGEWSYEQKADFHSTKIMHSYDHTIAVYIYSFYTVDTA